MNRVTLVGRLTKDPELKYTASNIAVISFTVAVDRTYKNANGEKQTDFINCVVWRKQAENMAKYTHKGSLIGIDGRIETRSYDKDGQKVYVTEVIADSVQFLDTKKTNDNQQQTQQTENKPANPFTNNNTIQVDKDPFEEFGNMMDISDSELPF